MMKKLSKNTKTLIYSGLGLLVLGAALLILILTQSEPEPSEDSLSDETADPRLIFTAYDSADVVSINVKNSGYEYIIEHIEDEAFDIAALLSAPRDNGKLSNAARYASGMKAVRVVEENAQELSKYGLASDSENLSVMTAIFRDGEEFTLFIGDDTPTTESMTYVRKAGEDTVYVIYSYYVLPFKNDLRYYVNLYVTDAYEDTGSPDVELIIIESREQERHIIEMTPPADEEGFVTSVNLHRFTEPVKVDLAYTASERLVYGMFGMRAERVEHVGPPGETNAEHYGFDEPYAVITMTAGGNTSALTVGRRFTHIEHDKNGGISSETQLMYVMYSEYPDVIYVFSPDWLPWLSVDIEAVMSPTFLMPYIYNVAEFSLEYPGAGHNLSFTLEGEDADDEAYYLNSEPAEATPFKRLYQFCISAAADGFYHGKPDAASAALVARFTYVYRGADRSPDVVEFYDTGERSAVVSLNGETFFTIKKVYLTALADNISRYLAGEEINLSW